MSRAFSRAVATAAPGDREGGLIFLFVLPKTPNPGGAESFAQGQAAGKSRVRMRILPAPELCCFPCPCVLSCPDKYLNYFDNISL